MAWVDWLSVHSECQSATRGLVQQACLRLFASIYAWIQNSCKYKKHAYCTVAHAVAVTMTKTNQTKQKKTSKTHKKVTKVNDYDDDDWIDWLWQMTMMIDYGKKAVEVYGGNAYVIHPIYILMPYSSKKVISMAE